MSCERYIALERKYFKYQHDYNFPLNNFQSYFQSFRDL